MSTTTTQLVLRALILLHPKSMPDESIQQWYDFVRSQVPVEITVTTGRDDFMHMMKREGGPAAWTRGVATRYDGAFVPTSDGTIGRFTAGIIEAMLVRSKPVSILDARGQATRISRVTKTTGKSKDGWVLS